MLDNAKLDNDIKRITNTRYYGCIDSIRSDIIMGANRRRNYENKIFKMHDGQYLCAGLLSLIHI